ncbi:MAG TPA: D-alanyl-D-alanine carboxypeptidase [Blastocatellia bacterium]|nr:D-alanyl-D-alanine carboxypeptidase [Blastocatellia bacterium]
MDAGCKADHTDRTAEALKKLLFLPIILLLLVPVVIFLLPPREAQLESPQAFTPPPLPPQQLISLHSLSEYKEDLASRGQSLDDQGVLIESLDGQKTFAEHNPDITFNPASVMKLATSLVALSKLGPDYRYRTNILADGVIDHAARKLEGDLVVEGNADPMFSTQDAQDVAVELSRLGISRVTGALRIAGPFYYFATGYRSNLSRETSAAKLRAAIQRAGIRIDGSTVFGDKSGTLLLAHYSEELVRLLLYQNAHSSNAIAEVIGESVGGPQSVQSFLIKQTGLRDSEIYVGRTSGLDFNRITPRASLKMLRALLSTLANYSLKAEDVMPVAGIDTGTLRGRFESDNVRGSVIAKTGTLVSLDNGVSTLVGIAYTKTQGPLLFAVFNSDGGVHAYRRLQDEFIEHLITEEGGPSPVSRVEDALADTTRHSIVQVMYKGNAHAAASNAD